MLLFLQYLVFCLSLANSAHAQQSYRNPVINNSLPDPSVVKGQDGYFYLVATEDIHNVPVFRSHNLVDWKQVGTAFTDATRPTHLENGAIWAPDISYINGKYVIYYSLSKWGETSANVIGVATADRPEGPFTDQGKVKIAASENFALAETFLHSLRVIAPQNLLIYAFSTSTTTDEIGKNNTAELTFRCLGG